MAYKMQGFSGFKNSPITKKIWPPTPKTPDFEGDLEEQYQENWPEGDVTLKQQMESLKKDLKLAKKTGDDEKARKIKMDIASTKKDMMSSKKSK